MRKKVHTLTFNGNTYTLVKSKDSIYSICKNGVDTGYLLLFNGMISNQKPHFYLYSVSGLNCNYAFPAKSDVITIELMCSVISKLKI